jgi:hypothetical protein
MNDNGAFILIVAVLAIPLFIWAYNNDPAANPDLGDQREHDLEQPSFMFALIGSIVAIVIIFGLALSIQ